jgi:1,2-phenylacetyl-CoA epoxidase catalytic subunit
MEKVYRIYEHIYEDNYSPSEEHTLGIFTDKAVVVDIVSKLEINKQNKLAECEYEYRKFNELFSKLSYEERFHYNHSEEYKDLCYEAQQLEYTNYNIETIIINKLHREL